MKELITGEIELETGEKERCVSEEKAAEPIKKQSRCTRTKMVWIAITIALLGIAGIILGIYFGVEKKQSHYNSPKLGVVFYGNYTGSLQQNTYNSTNRVLEDLPPDQLSTQITFIVVGNSEDTIEMIVIPGTIVENELRNLRFLEDENEDEKEMAEIPFFIVTASTDEGKILSMKASTLVDQQYTQSIVTSVQMALVSSKGDKQAANETSDEICEDYSDVLYCPTYKRRQGANNYVLAAEYSDKSLNKHRMLKESDELIAKSTINIEKLSYISDSGDLTKSHAYGEVSIPLISNDTNTQNLTLIQDVTADFAYSSSPLTDKTCSEIKELFKSFETVDVNLKPEHRSSIGKNVDETDSHENSGRNLQFKIENKIKLLDVLGMPISLNFLLEETPNSNLRATTRFEFSNILHLSFGSQEFGNGFISKLKKLFTLKNMYESLINEIRDVVMNFADNEFLKYNNLVLAKLNEIQGLIAESSDKLIKFINGLLALAQGYSDKVENKINEAKQQLENQIKEFQSTMQSYTDSTVTPLKNKLKTVEGLKEKYENELNENVKVLNDLKENTLKKLNTEKNNLVNQINEEIKKHKLYENIEKAYAETSTELSNFAKKQIEDLELVKTASSYYQQLSSTAKEELGNLNTYVQSELLEYKSKIDTRISELSKNVEDVKTQIHNEVTLVTNQISSEIQDLNSKVAEIEQKIQSSIESEKQNLIAQRDALLAQVNEKKHKLENEIAQKKELLENQKKDFEETLNLKLEEARSDLNSKLNEWKDQTESIQKTLTNQLSESILVAENTLNQAKSTLNTKVQSLKNTINDEVKEKRDVLEQSISSIEEQLELEVLNLESIYQLKTEINSALEYGKSEIQSFNSELIKTKEQLSEEINSIKTGIQNQILYVEGELKSKVYDARAIIDSEILSKQQQINDLRSQVENAAEETLNELQLQITSLETQVSDLQSNLLNLKTLESELLDQKQNYENKLNEIKQVYTYQLYLKANSFKEFYTAQESRVKQIASKIQNIDETLEFCAKSIKSTSEAITKDYTEEIEPYPDNIDSTIKNLNITEQNLVASIVVVEIQVANITSKNDTLNLLTLEATINLTGVQTELGIALEFYQSLEASFNDATTMINSMKDGTYDWKSFFEKNELFSVVKDIEKEINSVFTLLSTTFSNFEVAVNEFTKAFDQMSSVFTTLSRDKSSNIVNSGSNINNLPLTNTLNSQTSLFDYSYFTKTIDQITGTFNKLKDSMDTLSNLASGNVKDSMDKLTQIINPNFWEEKLNTFISKFQDIQNKYKVNLNINNYKQQILDKLEKVVNEKLVVILKSLSVADKLNGIKNDFISNTLQSFLSSKNLVGKFISYLGELTTINVNLVNFGTGQRIYIGAIATPVGIIYAYLDMSGNLRVDLATMLSAEKLSTSLAAGAGLGLSASAGWNFAIGEVGVGASIRLNAGLPIGTGIEFNNPGFFLWVNLDLSIQGNAGVYYKIITFGWRRVCWGRRWWRVCVGYPTISYSEQRWITSSNWNQASSTAIVPYKRIGF